MNLHAAYVLPIKQAAVVAPIGEWMDLPVDVECPSCGKLFRAVTGIRVDLRNEKYFQDAVISELHFQVAREPRTSDPGTDQVN